MQDPERLTQPFLSVRVTKAKCWVSPDEELNASKISVCVCARDETEKPEIFSAYCRSVSAYLELKLSLEYHMKPN